jgi:glyceraldehyde 3-phosphate dehydrogenase
LGCFLRFGEHRHRGLGGVAPPPRARLGPRQIRETRAATLSNVVCRRDEQFRELPRMTKVAINGFGRIGRLVARAILERPDCGLELVSVNDLADATANAWLFKRDSVHGKFPGEVTTDGNDIVVNGKRIQVTAERDPAKLRHRANGVELALECTGFFADRAGGEKHLAAGAKRVLISAPAKGADLTVVYGVNDDKLSPEHKIVSNASCTTNCLAPVAKVLNDALGIEQGFMTTVHAYTNDQKILDQIHSDLRRARAAAMSIIPTTTGAARAVGEVLPELKGKLDGSAMRVPVPDVSLVDLKIIPGRETDRDEVNRILKAASESERLKGILDFTDEPLVSIDLMHTAASSTIDSLETAVIEGRLVRVVSWYDNEWGFSNRMVDTACAMAKLG